MLQYAREKWGQSLWCVILWSVDLFCATFLGQYQTLSNFIKVWYLGNWFLFVPHQQPISVWGHDTRACICNAHQRSAILRWICMWRAELDTNISPTISLHNQGNLHAWVLLKVSVISYFLSRWWGRRGDAAAGQGVSYTGDWAQHFCLSLDLIQHIFRRKRGDTKALSCRQPRAASLAQVKKSHGGNLSSIVCPRGTSRSLPHCRHTPKVWLSSSGAHML